ncbi:MAG: hypothetical protein R6V36_06560 [Psychroflexus sp.]
MTQITKKTIMASLAGGIVSSGVMAGFDYMEGLDFRPQRFFFNFFCIGGFLGIFTKYNLKNTYENSSQK